MVQPHEEPNLNEIVERNPRHEEGRDVLHDRKDGEHHPVRQPLRVVGGLGRLDGLEGHVGGVDEGDEVRHQLHPAHGVDEGGDHGRKGEREVRLGLAGALLEVPEAVCAGMNEKDQALDFD